MELENDAFLFSDAMFVIEPIQGTIWPNSHVDVNVYFNPNTAGSHGKTVYCQVSGRETRLPLQLKVNYFINGCVCACGLIPMISKP
jgi:hydrocephalus-inducing protein